MPFEIGLAVISFFAGWLINHLYSRQGSKELKKLNDGLQNDNRELRGIVEKLPAEVANTLAADKRQRLSLDELNGLLRTFVAQTEKRPLIQVRYAWQENEPKEQPFIITNSGDDEARNIQIQPIVLDRERRFTFENVGQIVPNGPAVEREPRPEHEVGPIFRSLIDGIETAVNDRSRELKVNISTKDELIKQLNDHAAAEMQANDEFENIPVTVTYENRRGIVTTLHYRLAVTAFVHVTKVELHFVREGDA